MDSCENYQSRVKFFVRLFVLVAIQISAFSFVAFSADSSDPAVAKSAKTIAPNLVRPLGTASKGNAAVALPALGTTTTMVGPAVGTVIACPIGYGGSYTCRSNGTGGIVATPLYSPAAAPAAADSGGSAPAMSMPSMGSGGGGQSNQSSSSSDNSSSTNSVSRPSSNVETPVANSTTQSPASSDASTTNSTVQPAAKPDASAARADSTAKPDGAPAAPPKKQYPSCVSSERAMRSNSALMESLRGTNPFSTWSYMIVSAKVDPDTGNAALTYMSGSPVYQPNKKDPNKQEPVILHVSVCLDAEKKVYVMVGGQKAYLKGENLDTVPLQHDGSTYDFKLSGRSVK